MCNPTTVPCVARVEPFTTSIPGRRRPAEATMADTLERSFLEGKERDELAAIAGALGLKPSPRAKKDTVIDQIMRAAGQIETLLGLTGHTKFEKPQAQN